MCCCIQSYCAPSSNQAFHFRQLFQNGVPSVFHAYKQMPCISTCIGCTVILFFDKERIKEGACFLAILLWQFGIVHICVYILCIRVLESFSFFSQVPLVPCLKMLKFTSSLFYRDSRGKLFLSGVSQVACLIDERSGTCQETQQSYTLERCFWGERRLVNLLKDSFAFLSLPAFSCLYGIMKCPTKNTLHKPWTFTHHYFLHFTFQSIFLYKLESIHEYWCICYIPISTYGSGPPVRL